MEAPKQVLMNSVISVAKVVENSVITVKNQVVQQLSKPSVFGAAPSLSQMRAINSSNKGGKILFRGAFFWYYFRVYYPIAFPTLFLIFMIVSLTAWNTIEGHLVMGSILSLIGCMAVIGSYFMIIPFQKHPSTLVFYRTVTNIVFSIVIILEAISTNKDAVSCRNFAVATHYILLASESWLTTIASDLVHSLTNPFASYKANLNRYHILVWTFSALISFVLFFDKNCQGQFDGAICWVNVTSTNAPCLWGYYLFWIILMYSYQMWSFLFAYLRLKRGLGTTFEVRKKTAEETFKCLASYAVYLSFLVFFFGIISTNPSPQRGSSMANFSLFFLFVIANRGSVDSVIWFMLHDFQRDSPVVVDHKYTQPPANDPEAHVEDSHRDSGIHFPKRISTTELQKTVTKTITEIADFAIAEFDEADLSPQVNMALRQQIVQYVTQGVRDSILQKGLHRERKRVGGVDGFMERMMNPRTKDPAVTPGLKLLKFYLDQEHPFKAFEPEVFREIRFAEGFSDEKYLQILSQPANERLSEGASGAFMFFCGGGDFIVKTIRAREARVLHQSLPAYTQYLRDNPSSFLCRFFGSYSLRMYDQTFYFVVMMNCFDPKAMINERYDIKGSWVGRSADSSLAKRTKRVVCRHCNTYFVPAQQQPCSAIVGLHEANIVLKDNDLRTKISLTNEEANLVVSILKKDGELLGRLGVLDYSLLAGVKKIKFDVHVTDEEAGVVDDVKSKSSRVTYKAKTVTGPGVYHFGIVDFLQDWSTKKKIERMLKIYVMRKDPEGLSVMEPHDYMVRFLNKMDQIFDIDETHSTKIPFTAAVSAQPVTAPDDLESSEVLARKGFQSVQEAVVNPLLTVPQPPHSSASPQDPIVSHDSDYNDQFNDYVEVA